MKSSVVLQFNAVGGAFADANNNSGAASDGASHEKYGLRPRRRAGGSSTRGAPTPRAPPLSKYRRRTANARERTRMREINSAFEALRRRVPGGEEPGTTPAAERLTKISTLRLATQYIAALAAVLEAPCHDMPLSISSSSMTFSPSISPELPQSLCSDFSTSLSPDFPDSSLSPSEFMSSSFSSDFSDNPLSPFEPFLAEYS